MGQKTGTSNMGKKVAAKPSSTAFKLLHLRQQAQGAGGHKGSGLGVRRALAWQPRRTGLPAGATCTQVPGAPAAAAAPAARTRT